MSSSIGTQSIEYPSIFSSSESYVSTATQWTSESSIKLDHRGNRLDRHGRQKHASQMGRPPINWTASRLRRLIRLYLLTDLELDGHHGIINCLRTEDFQPCKRNVQEKLNLLLQPQPNKIRPKGDTKVLRKLLLECRHLQKTRRLRNQNRCYQFEQRRSSPGECNVATRSLKNGGDTGCSTTHDVIHTDASCIECVHPISLDIGNHIGTSQEIVPLEASVSLLPKEHNESYIAQASDPGFESATINSASNLTVPFLDWHLPDFGIEPGCVEYVPRDEDFNYSICPPPTITGPYNHINLDGAFPDPGFGSDFGYVGSKLIPTQESNFTASWSGTKNDVVACAESGDDLSPIEVPQTNRALLLSNECQLAKDVRPAINSTHMRDSFDNTSNFLPGTYSSYEFDAFDTSVLEFGPSHFTIFDHTSKPEDSAHRSSLSAALCPTLTTEHSNITNPSSSSCSISLLLSKMSLSPLSSLLGIQQSPAPTDDLVDLSIKVDSPLILPGVFPEYCWQHINQNILRRCNQWHGTPENGSKCHLNSIVSPTMYRSLRLDVLSRIIQRTIQAADIHEFDVFGNSVIHISATMFAPPSYLIYLVKLGANVNGLNSAGQTFLHLIKPTALSCCDDFCDLLEILSDQRFDFCRHDHLGQSPLHVLTRPWINPEMLRKIITKLDSLALHRHFSTSRDCLGYTVVGQINLQGSQSSGIDVDLEQAILSLACETEHPIVKLKDLQVPKGKVWGRNPSSKDEQPARNYENHPDINTLDDLLGYEQHVDYWRTIVAAKNSPWFEDSKGRNGLHCLAEASLISLNMLLPSPILGQVDSLKDNSLLNGRGDRERFVESLLNAGVDPNNYDHDGNTPLMAFILYCRADESDDSTMRILTSLLEAGSDICRRNRAGETALHLAIKLGHGAATKVLLDSGANVHARTSSGLGVLELGQMHSMECKRDEKLYAQIMLCISLAASFGALSVPTILDEWASPQCKLATSGHRDRKGFERVKMFIRRKSRKERWGSLPKDSR